MKTILLTVSAAVLGALASVSLVGQAQTGKTPSAVAYVSPSRILAESVHGRGEMARLQTLQQQRTNDIRTKQQAMQTTRQQMTAAPDGPARAELLQKESQQRAELEQLAQQAQVELQTMQREINQELQRRVKAVLDDLMVAQSYQMVVNGEASVMWANPELDLTTAVIRRLNGQ